MKKLFILSAIIPLFFAVSVQAETRSETIERLNCRNGHCLIPTGSIIKEKDLDFDATRDTRQLKEKAQACSDIQVEYVTKYRNIEDGGNGLESGQFYSKVSLNKEYQPRINQCTTVLTELRVLGSANLPAADSIEEMKGYTCISTDNGQRCTPNQIASTTEQQIEFLQKQIADLILLVSQILALQSK